MIKIEPPPRKDAQEQFRYRWSSRPDEQNLHRNKRSLAIDLKHSEGRALFHRLARDADVVVENFRSSVKYRLGVDYETTEGHQSSDRLRQHFGFRSGRPRHEQPGVDQIIQGMSGLMSITGEPEQGPMRVGVPFPIPRPACFWDKAFCSLLHRGAQEKANGCTPPCLNP